jgi:hypothetical protein
VEDSHLLSFASFPGAPRIGSSLRWATQDISREELPANIKHLLARLERFEARAQAKSEEPDNNPAP